MKANVIKFGQTAGSPSCVIRRDVELLPALINSVFECIFSLVVATAYLNVFIFDNLVVTFDLIFLMPSFQKCSFNKPLFHYNLI